MKASKIFYLLGIGATLVVIALLYFYRTQTVWVESKPYTRILNKPAQTLVVVYSRTGNTMSAAKKAAKFFDADLLKIEAPLYSRDLKGQQLAAKHADEEITTTVIKHDLVNIKDYKLIILCSPTWWYRPAVPLWSFVENHNFAGKSVFLIMTGNSRKTDEKTGKFKTLVKQKNGNLLDVLFIRRGRIYWQKTKDQVNNEVISGLKKRENMWSEIFKE